MIKKTENNKKSNKKKIILISILFFVIVLFIFCFAFISSLISNTYLNKDLLNSFSSPISLYDANGNKLADSINGSPCVKINTLHKYTLDSFIDIEDKQFYSHNGINFPRMIKAFFTNLSSGKIEQGASTITQQLIKNTHLTNEKSYQRKIKEVVLALQLEKEYSKDEILEMYLNAIYFGNGCYGIESASNFYFNKKACDLNINESAILAGIIKSPKYYSPITNAKNIKNRKNLILGQMLESNDITQAEFDENIKKDVELDLSFSSYFNNQAYYENAISEASDILNTTPSMIACNGFKIYTYFDKEANDNLELNSSTETNALHNSIIVDNQSFGVIAYSSSYLYDSLNIRRTPASTVKPFLVYAPACENGNIQPSTLILDEKTTFNSDYSPKNINDIYYGNISASSALAKSLNVPAVKILEKISIKSAKKFASNLEIPFSEKDNGLSLALGSMYNGITIQELVNAYSPFVFDGKFNKLSFIKEIKDKNGSTIYQRQLENKTVMSEQTSYLVGSMLKESVQSGTCKALKQFNFDIHAKSGTNGTDDSSKNTDSLCIAQTTKHTCCVWYFSKDNKSENLLSNANISGLSPTLRIKNIFESLYKNSSPKNFTKPAGIEEVYLDLLDYNDGIISVASVKTPQEYKFVAEFNTKFTPKNNSLNFTNLITPIISYVKNDDNITISYTPQKSQQYELVIEEYDKNYNLLNYTSNIFENLSGKTSCSFKINSEYNYKIYINSNFLNSTDYTTSNTVEIKNTQANTLWFL